MLTLDGVIALGLAAVGVDGDVWASPSDVEENLLNHVCGRCVEESSSRRFDGIVEEGSKSGGRNHIVAG